MDFNNESTLSPPVTLAPDVHLGITVAFTVVFSLLFFVIFLEMMLLLYYKHKLLSFQSVFLFVCLLWSALRLELFTFYFSKRDGLITSLAVGAYFTLYALPVVFQYVTLSLLVLYFSRVWIKLKERSDTHTSRYFYSRARIVLYSVWSSLIVLMLAVNLIVSVLMKRNNKTIGSECIHHHSSLVLIRVVFTECLFLLNTFILAYLVFRVYRSASANAMLETQGTTVFRATFLSLLLTVVFLSRAVFNFAVMADAFPCYSYAYSWLNASDEGDVGGDSGSHYVTFVFSIFFWELLPTVAIIFFFRIRPTSLPDPRPNPVQETSPVQARFFDNPKRYDSDAEDEMPGPLPAFRFAGNPTTPAINPVYGSMSSAPSSLPTPAYATPQQSGTPTYDYRAAVGSGSTYHFGERS